MTRASIHHETHANELVPLKDVYYEESFGNGCMCTPLQMWSCRHWKMDSGACINKMACNEYGPLFLCSVSVHIKSSIQCCDTLGHNINALLYK